MKIKYIIACGSLILGSLGNLSAQRGSGIDREDRKMLAEQAGNIFEALDPLVNQISESVVLFKVKNRVVALGTVTNKGIVTKFSEIQEYGSQDLLRIVTKDGEVSSEVNLVGIYEDYDLAVIENVLDLPAVNFKKSVTPEVGSFLVASTASDEALAMGVVSVKPRSLKEKDRGFLGVVMDMTPAKGGGVRLNHVEMDTAASEAGLQKGDIIMSINGDTVKNMLEMRNFLQQLQPGDHIRINFKRGDVVTAGLKVVLGARQEIPRVRLSRMNTMKKMGGRVNEVSEGFPRVLQSDMKIQSKFCGAPVVDLDGDLVGLVVAKASRIKAYIIEGQELAKLLETEPDR